MDIHKPKPWHGWRGFLKEYGIIVLGVLTALAFEEVARVAHDHATEQEARDAVYAEVRQNLSYMQGRLVTQDCVERRLDEIGTLVAKAREGEISPDPQWIGQPSIWFMADQRWQAATGSGRASLFSPNQQSGLAGVYVLTKQFAEAESREQAAWAQLRGLESWSGPLGAAGRVHFVTALQTARYELWEIRILSGVAFQRAQALGLRDLTPKAQSEGYSIPHAVCLPINTPREKALAILNRDSPPWGQPK